MTVRLVHLSYILPLGQVRELIFFALMMFNCNGYLEDSFKMLMISIWKLSLKMHPQSLLQLK